jgi:hypothetical protein
VIECFQSTTRIIDASGDQYGKIQNVNHVLTSN